MSRYFCVRDTTNSTGSAENPQPSSRNENDGHRDVKTAMHCQQPELEIVRAALDYRPPTSETVA